MAELNITVYVNNVANERLVLILKLPHYCLLLRIKLL